MSTPEKRSEIIKVVSTYSDSEEEVGTCIFTYHNYMLHIMYILVLSFRKILCHRQCQRLRRGLR